MARLRQAFFLWHLGICEVSVDYTRPFAELNVSGIACSIVLSGTFKADLSICLVSDAVTVHVHDFGAYHACGPESTSSISQFRLTLRYRSAAWVKRAMGGDSLLHIDIVDYPGEWLLDLPLMTLDFQTWSRQVFAATEQEPRRGLAQDWLAATREADLNAKWDERDAQRLHQTYAEYLRQCRCATRVKLSMLQPGRFLMPGDLAGSPALTFAPLPLRPGQALKNGSLAAGMAKRL